MAQTDCGSTTTTTGQAIAEEAIVKSQDEHDDDEPKCVETKQDKENCQRDRQDEEEEIKNCFECKRSLAVTPQLIDIAGQAHKWHPECFKCNICHEPMDRAKSCHIYKDKIVCKNDYIRLRRDTSIDCARCHWPVGPVDWIRKAGNYVYHLACFNCDICLRQLNTGEQFAINIQERDHIVRLLCRLHFTIVDASNNNNNNDNDSIQNGNNQKLQARTQMPIDDWNQFNEQQKSNSTLLHHFQKPDGFDPSPHPRQQQRQSGCSSSGPRKSPLNCGDVDTATPLAQSSSALTPTNHQDTHSYNSLNQSLSSPSPGCGSMESLEVSSKLIEATKFNSNNLSIRSTASTTKQPLHHHLHHSQAQYQHSTSASTSSLSSDGSSNSSGGSQITIPGGGNSNNNNNLPSKSKRVRTTFTEDQLAILQNHFHIDSNPDGQDLERIATITGLSKRVTQVWFQNSRARQKKYMIKRKPGTSSLSGVGSDSGSGLPMTTNLIASAASIALQPSSPQPPQQPPPTTTTTTTALNNQGQTSNNLLIDSIRSIHRGLAATSECVKDHLSNYQVDCSVDGDDDYQSNDDDTI